MIHTFYCGEKPINLTNFPNTLRPEANGPTDIFFGELNKWCNSLVNKIMTKLNFAIFRKEHELNLFINI